MVSESRSRNMAAIKAKDTKPELQVRKALRAAGFRFSLHRKDLPGRPDIVLPKYRLVVLVHGCFWHRHADCKLAYTPKSNKLFWLKKFSDNMSRDSATVRKLNEMGWRTLVIWECGLRDKKRSSHLINFLRQFVPSTMTEKEFA
jgi:DNA mismatch endonuclease (patch repair protein)